MPCFDSVGYTRRPFHTTCAGSNGGRSILPLHLPTTPCCGRSMHPPAGRKAPNSQRSGSPTRANDLKFEHKEGEERSDLGTCISTRRRVTAAFWQLAVWRGGHSHRRLWRGRTMWPTIHSRLGSVVTARSKEASWDSIRPKAFAHRSLGHRTTHPLVSCSHLRGVIARRGAGCFSGYCE